MLEHERYGIGAEDSKPTNEDTDSGEDRADDGTELGAIRIHHNVIAIISRIAALKIPGVADMSGSFADGLAGMLGKSTTDRGVKVEVDAEGVSVELHIIIEYGIRIPQVAWQIQNDVRQAIEDMTGKRVKRVDVVVQGVHLPAHNQKEENTAL